MKIVINKCYGGFGLSPEALLRLYELGCTEIATPVEKWFGRVRKSAESALMEWHLYQKTKIPSIMLTAFSPDEKYVLYESNIDRNNPLLIQVVEELGEKSFGTHALLSIVEIPDGVEWEIDEYDGREHIAEKHRTWG